MRVLFAPDWRAGNQYQSFLAEALAGEGVEVIFPRGWRRGLPLSRMVRQYQPDLLHLHWPEAYYGPKGDLFDGLRLRRFPLDLRLSLRLAPLAVTAHNLVPHDSHSHAGVRGNQAFAYRSASAVFVHSSAAARTLTSEFDLPRERHCLIPHGDLSATLGAPLPRQAALEQLGLRDRPVCLMIGTVRPYKGIEEVIDFWRMHQPAAVLAIAGLPGSEDYRREIELRSAGVESVHLDLAWQPDDRLRLWLSAANCVLFNYTNILTSGAAPLARAWGIPLLLPKRLETVEIGEPNPLVRRFDALDVTFADSLQWGLVTPTCWEAGETWREECSWGNVARATAREYRIAVEGGPRRASLDMAR